MEEEDMSMEEVQRKLEVSGNYFHGSFSSGY